MILRGWPSLRPGLAPHDVSTVAPIRRPDALARAGVLRSSAPRSTSGEPTSSYLSRDCRPSARLERSPGRYFGFSLAFLVASALALPEQAEAKPAARSTSIAVRAKPSVSIPVSNPPGTAASDVLGAAVDVRARARARRALTHPPGWRLVRRTASRRGDVALTQSVYVYATGALTPRRHTWRFPRAATAVAAIVSIADADVVAPIAHHSGFATTRGRRIIAPSVVTPVADALVLGFFGTSAPAHVEAPRGTTRHYRARARAGPTGIGVGFSKPAVGRTGTVTAKSARRNAINIGQVVVINPARAPTDPNHPPPAPPPPPGGSVLWTADMEEGTLADWYFPEIGAWGNHGGGEYSDGGDSAASNSGGAWSARQAIALSAARSSGTRLFRWHEPDRHSALYYSAWFLFPEEMVLQPGGWFNLMQWKSIRDPDNDPMWAVLVGNRPDGGMYLYLGRQPHVPGPRYTHSSVNIPVGRWFRVDAFYRSSSGTSGRVTVWQDGRQLFDIDGVRTSYDAINGAGNPWSVQWSVNAYGCCFSPASWTHYVDDATIALPPRALVSDWLSCLQTFWTRVDRPSACE